VRVAHLVLAVLVALAGCEEEVVPTTQIVVVVEADEELEAQIGRLDLVATHRDGSTTSRQIEVDGENPLPLSFSLVPGIDTEQGELLVQARTGGGELLDERRLRLGFASRRTLGYGILFSAACLDLRGTCEAAGETCVNCACGAVDVPPEALTRLRRTDDVFDAWLPRLTCEPGHAEDAGT
jgi:hypothetical protein